jgi:ribulose-5-phosphate 4-epimerase/fuculose-1-phosphate aldolase
MNVMASPMPGIAAEEWQTRCDLAALYRLVAYHRWTDLIYTHITAKVPGTEHFLINRYGVLFDHMRASDLVKLDLDGNEVGNSGSRINLAGYTIHSAVHGARKDATCVVHTHTAAGIAVSAQKHGLLPISQHALRFHGRLGYHGYEGIALDQDECPRLVRDLGPHPAMILQNHGLLVAGRTIPEAWSLIYYLERACAAQVAALSGGAEIVVPPREVQDKTAAQFNGPNTLEHSAYAWECSLALIAGQGTDWRQ